MTDDSHGAVRFPSPEQRARISRGLFNTIPIMLAGSMALSLNVTGPVQSVDARKDKPRSTPSELGKSIRDAFTAASRATSMTPTVAATVVASAPTTYTVQAGDTVSSIAGRYGLATASVLALNGLGWKSVIFAGQSLKLTSAGPVKVAAPVTAAPAAAGRYTIQKGDSIGGIAARYGLSTQTLLSANGLGWSSIIYPGRTLAIPGATTLASVVTPIVATPAVAQKPAAASHYLVVSGDTISKIASKFGVSSQALLDANGLGWSSIIFAGKTLVIPAAGSAAASVSATPLSADPSLGVVPLTATMKQNARTIVAVGRSLGVPDYGLVIALAAAAQESGLVNLPYGDRDSLGLFQQRPSTGWGTTSQLLDTTYAARLFFGGATNPNKGVTRGLLDISGWQSRTVTQAAQAVQLSGFPDAYAKWEVSARAWLPTVK